MKTILASLILVASAFGQASITLTDIDQIGFSVPVTINATAFPNIIAFIQTLAPSTAWPNTAGAPVNTTLAAAITDTGGSCTGVTGADTNSKCSTITLTNASNLAQCNGLQIGTESFLVYSVNQSTGATIVTRKMLGTTAATHPLTNGATPPVPTQVIVTRVGDGTCLFKAFIADAVSNIVQQQHADTTTSAASTAVTTNQATITSTANGAIQ